MQKSKFVSRFNGADRANLLELSQKCIWTSEGKPGLSYLMERRGLSDQVIKSFGLGYVPYTVNHQLFGRIIFPLYDASHNLIALMSRDIGLEPTYLPVYWHERYEKGFYVYGIEQAKESMRRLGFVIVVEGQIDNIQCHNHKMTNVVALCGTAMKMSQLAVIHRYCDEIILALDSDDNRSGQKGAKRIMRMAAGKPVSKYDSLVDTECRFDPSGYKVASVTLPNDTDPDEFIRKQGIEAMKVLIRPQVRELRKSNAD